MKYLYLLVPLSLFLLTGTPSFTFANLLGRLFLIETVKANENQNQNVKSYKIVKEISVQILGAAGSGSGVLVRKEEEKYTVLTAWHVIKDNLPGEEIEIVTFDGEVHLTELSTLERIGEVDLALISFKSKNNYSVANLQTNQRVNQKILVGGFPLGSKGELTINQGRLIASSSFGDDGYNLLYNNSTFPGMSGGAIINEEGKLIGIHGRGEIDNFKLKRSDLFIKTRVNLGIPSDYYYSYINGEEIKLNNRPSSFQDFIVHAEIHKRRNRNDLKSLLDIFDNALEVSKNKKDIAIALRGKASILVEKGQINEALNLYSIAIKNDPKDLYSYFGKAFVLAKQKKFNDSKNVLNFILENLSNEYEDIDYLKETVFMQRGIIKGNLNDLDGAEKDINESIEIALNSNEISFNKLLGDFNAWERHAYKYLLIGGIYSEKIKNDLQKNNEFINKDFSKSIENYKRAIDISESERVKKNALFEIGNLYFWKEDYKQALKYFEEALSYKIYLDVFTNDLDEYIYAKIGSSAKFIGDKKNAIDSYKKAINISSSPNILLEIIKNEIGEDNVIELYDYAIKLNKEVSISSKLLLQRAKLKDKLGLPSAAIIDYEKSIELNPKLFDAYILLADINHDLGDHEKSVKLYNKLLVIDPKESSFLTKNRGNIFYNAAISQGLLGQKGKSCNNFFEASKLNHKEAKNYLNSTLGFWCKELIEEFSIVRQKSYFKKSEKTVVCKEPLPEFTLQQNSSPSDMQVKNLCSCIWNQFPENRWERKTAIKIFKGYDPGWKLRAFARRFGKAVEDCGGYKL